jgi:hypothetical protein
LVGRLFLGLVAPVASVWRVQRTSLHLHLTRLVHVIGAHLELYPVVRLERLGYILLGLDDRESIAHVVDHDQIAGLLAGPGRDDFTAEIAVLDQLEPGRQVGVDVVEAPLYGGPLGVEALLGGRRLSN